MPTSPTQRSLKEMRKQGYLCGIVEKWNSFAHIRQDLFGIIDIVCIRDSETVGLQTTSYPNLSAHRKKVLQSTTLRPWLRAGNRFVLHGWKKTKDGKHILKQQELVLAKDKQTRQSIK